jgi:4-amino-4-deoxy-L-arabinose transferase-like glycosyltransferase
VIGEAREDARRAARRPAAGTSAAGRARAFYAAHPWAADLTLLAIVTVAAAVLRLTLLGEIPYGVHSDEAQLGTDGRKILDGKLWSVYTTAVLGQPSGHAYLTLPSFLLLGWTPLAMRLPLALVALAAVPLLYAVVRQSFGRAEAFFAAALLTVSYWHLFYSRVAVWSISYGTITLAVLLCLLRGMQTRRRWWFGAAGVLLGLGLYTYNIYPIAVIAVAAFLAIVTLTRERRNPRWWTGSMLLFAGAGAIVALPMIIYVADPDSWFWWHLRNYSEVSVWQTAEFKNEDLWGRARLILQQAETFVGAYAYDPAIDIVDGNGSFRPMFDPPTLMLLILGLGFAWRERRRPAAVALLCSLLIIPLPAVLQQGSIMRQPVAAAPAAMFLAALPLAALWRAAAGLWERRKGAAVICGAAAALLLALIAVTTVRDYFWTMRKDPFVREIYFSEETTASDYMRGLPDDAYVLFYSYRASLSLETRQFLAPDVDGEDRSSEFSNWNGSIEEVDRSRFTVFVLLEPYQTLLEQIEQRYPGGVSRTFSRDGKFELSAYELPPE